MRRDEARELGRERVVVRPPVRIRRRAISRSSGTRPSRYSGSPVKKRVGTSSVLFAPGYIGAFSGGRLRSIA